jgi:UDPglucose 6-dehydrogenase
MRLVMIGTGYVGLVSGACFAEMGNRVVCVDVDAAKIEALQAGRIPIHEPGLEELVLRNVRRGHLGFTTDLDGALQDAEIALIAVGTPMSEDGSADLRHVLAAARAIGRQMAGDLVVVDKSTVPVGTADQVRSAIRQELDRRSADFKVEVVSNPEFLKEGSAVDDFLKPDRVIVGTDTPAALEVMKLLYAPFMMKNDRLIPMDVRSAEMTKYAANAMLAVRISFINEMAAICEKVGADINKVRIGIGSDPRIGPAFIYPGCGYGGCCFPKDVQALVRTARDHGVDACLTHAVEEVNRRQKLVMVDKVAARFGQDLSGLTFAVWGLAFKANTDDMREASSLVIIRELLRRGARIRAYDPGAMEKAKTFWLKDVAGIEYAADMYAALDGATALLLVTEWTEFRSPDFDEIRRRLNTPVIFDGRNQYVRFNLAQRGFEHWQIGVAPALPQSEGTRH